MGKASNRKKQRRASDLKAHQKKGRQLLPPMLAAKFPLHQVDYQADILPELLWVAAIAAEAGWDRFHNPAHVVLDKLAEVLGNEGPLGTMSSFGEVEEAKRQAVLEALKGIPESRWAFPESFLHAIGIYPDGPMAWMVEIDRPDHIDPERGLNYLKGLVRSIWDSKGVNASRCRMVPLGRILKAGKMVFMKGRTDRIVELLPRYPSDLDGDGQQEVESISRALFLGVIQARPQPAVWPQMFWRANWRLSRCEPLQIASRAEKPEEGVDPSSLVQHLRDLDVCIGSELRRLFEQASLDLYDSARDEVLFGILSRSARLFRLLNLSPANWNLDTLRLCVRSLADAQITIAWLVRRKDPALFRKFQEYGRGRLKLLKLHVQKLVDDTGRQDLEPYLEALEEELNAEIMEEFMPIDLAASFSGISAREMAREVGLGDLYNLVYSPASGHLHGDWTSLQAFDLIRCGNPLHRFHHIPDFAAEGVLDPRGVSVALGILLDTIEVVVGAYQLAEIGERTRRCADQFYAALGPEPKRKETSTGGRT